MTDNQLSKRERQIMDIIYRKSEANAKEVMNNLPKPPSYSAVRALLRILVDKGFLSHKKSGLKYIYTPVVPQNTARKRAVQHLISTYFQDSMEDAVAAILNVNKDKLTQSDFSKLSKFK